MIDSEGEARHWLRALPECDDLAIERLERLATMLREENQRQNLVSATSLQNIWQRHIVDSAQLLPHVPRGTTPWMDLGTGAGFPGLVIAILRPDIEIFMVESRVRRIAWLDHARTMLELDHARVLGSRVEQIASRKVGAISARAFAPLPRLLELSARFSTADTLWLLPKGRSARDELEQLQDWSHTFHVEQSVTDSQSGVIIGTLDAKKGTAS